MRLVSVWYRFETSISPSGNPMGTLRLLELESSSGQHGCIILSHASLLTSSSPKPKGDKLHTPGESESAVERNALIDPPAFSKQHRPALLRLSQTGITT